MISKDEATAKAMVEGVKALIEKYELPYAETAEIFSNAFKTSMDESQKLNDKELSTTD